MMNRGLVVKELYTLRKQMKSLLFIISVFTIVALYSGDTGVVTYVNTLLMMLGLIINLSSLTEDEKCNWDTYGLTLPVRRSEVIGVRYLMVLVFLAAAMLYITVLHGLIYIIHGLSMTAGMISSAIMLALIVLLQSILFPVAVKSGSAKARIYMFAIMGIPFVLIALFIQMVDESVWRGWLPSEQVLIQLAGIAKFAVPVILLVILTISYRISVSVFTKKEF